MWPPLRWFRSCLWWLPCVPSCDLILRWQAPRKMLPISLDGGTLEFLLAAGLLTVIGWAMGEAARVKAENEGFV